MNSRQSEETVPTKAETVQVNLLSLDTRISNSQETHQSAVMYARACQRKIVNPIVPVHTFNVYTELVK